MDGLLGALPEEERRTVLAMARRRRFKRNEVVCHEGDPADTLHLIVKGRVAIRATSPLGSVVTMAVLGLDDTFGELALFDDDARRTATVVAMETTETLTLYRDEVHELRRRAPAIDDAIIRMLVGQVARLSSQLVEALYMPVDDRVVRRLADLVAIYRHHDGQVEIPLTQEEIASLAGTTRPTANAVLRRLEDAGALELKRGTIVVLDPAAIEH